MKLSNNGLKSFSRRVFTALAQGHTIAYGKQYAEYLAGALGVKGQVEGSAAELASLCNQATDRIAPEVVREAPAVHLEPIVEAPVAVAATEPAPAPESIPAPIETAPEAPVAAPVPVVSEAVEYEAMTKDALYKEATAREIVGRGDMNKAELIEALKASDLA